MTWTLSSAGTSRRWSWVFWCWRRSTMPMSWGPQWRSQWQSTVSVQPLDPSHRRVIVGPTPGSHVTLITGLLLLCTKGRWSVVNLWPVLGLQWLLCERVYRNRLFYWWKISYFNQYKTIFVLFIAFYNFFFFLFRLSEWLLSSIVFCLLFL